MTKVRWGVLSTARIGAEQVIPAIHRAANAELVAVASRNAEKGRAFAEANGIPKVYDNYMDLLNATDIDAVYIPLPNHLHAEWTIEAAKHGKHVLCEKPAGLDAEQTATMVEACRANGVHFMEAFMYPFHPQWDFVQQVIAAGDIGEVKVVHASHSFRLEDVSDIRLQPEMGGGSLYDVGCYCVHAIRTLAGDEEPSDVQALAQFAKDGRVDWTLTATLRFPNGLLAHFDSSFELPGRQHVEIGGTKGSILVTLPFRPDHGSPQVNVKRASGSESHSFDPDGMYTLEVEHFSDCVLNGTSPRYSGEQTIRNMRIIDRIYEAAGRKN